MGNNSTYIMDRWAFKSGFNPPSLEGRQMHSFRPGEGTGTPLSIIQPVLIKSSTGTKFDCPSWLERPAESVGLRQVLADQSPSDFVSQPNRIKPRNWAPARPKPFIFDKEKQLGLNSFREALAKRTVDSRSSLTGYNAKPGVANRGCKKES